MSRHRRPSRARVTASPRRPRTRSSGRRRGEGDTELRRRAGKEFLVRAHSFEDVELGLDDAWLAACISPRMLDVASGYLRLWPKLSYADLWYSIAQPEATDTRRVAALAPRLRRQAPAEGVPLPPRRRRGSRAVRVRPGEPAGRPVRGREPVAAHGQRARAGGRGRPGGPGRADPNVRRVAAERSSSATRVGFTAAASRPKSRESSQPRHTAHRPRSPSLSERNYRFSGTLDELDARARFAVE